MVHIHPITGSTTETRSQHNKCANCKGTQLVDFEIVKCSHVLCGKHFHVKCIAPAITSLELAELPHWYCSHTCGEADKDNRTAQEASKTELLAQNAKLLAEINKLRSQNEALTLNNTQLLHSSKLLESEASRLRASSTIHPSSHHLNDVTLDASSIYVTANLDQTLNHLIEHSFISSSSQPSQQSNAADSSSTSAPTILNSNDTQQAHALSSIILTLSERRKHLPDLPEFSGKGSEWLCFRNCFNKLRQMGKYDDDEMIAKLRKALRGTAFEYARTWLFSARSNPSQIMSDLEEKFFCPSAVITDSFDIITAVPFIKDKTRSSLEKLKRAVDEYISVCTDVEETIHLTGRVPETISDKLPDDLYEKWQRAIRKTEHRGDWFNFSSFLTESTRDLKVRASDRKRSEKPTTSRVNATSSASTKPTFQGELPPCDFDDCGKVLFRCEGFSKKPYSEKTLFCERKKYCFKCLRKGHYPETCPNRDFIPPCRRQKCLDPKDHSTLMHPTDFTSL